MLERGQHMPLLKFSFRDIFSNLCHFFNRSSNWARSTISIGIRSKFVDVGLKNLLSPALKIFGKKKTSYLGNKKKRITIPRTTSITSGKIYGTVKRIEFVIQMPLRGQKKIFLANISHNYYCGHRSSVENALIS